MEAKNSRRQFTGYIDKCLRLICEGDKLRMTDANTFDECFVKWHYGAYVVVFDDGSSDWLSAYALGDQYEIEVIGNIHVTLN